MRIIVSVTTVLLLLLSGCVKEPVKNGESSIPGVSSKNVHESSVTVPDDIQSTIISKISALPELKKAQKNIASVTGGKSGVSFIIEKTDNQNSYSVQAGYNGAERFETYYFFSVEPVTYKIRILDTLTDEYVTMDVWRKRESKRSKK